MTGNIAILGLNQWGVSAAMALAEKDSHIHLAGWSPSGSQKISANHKKIFKEVAKDLPSAVKNAKIILLMLGPDELEQVAEELGRLVTQEKVVINFTFLHRHSADLLKPYLKDPSRYVSILPALNPARVLFSDFQKCEPYADLFKEGIIYLVDPLQADSMVLDLAIDLSVLLGGNPMLSDPLEVDGLIAMNLLLPDLTASALMAGLSSQPGWREGKLLAGSALAGSTQCLQDPTDAADVGRVIFHQRENMVRGINGLIDQLMKYRRFLEMNDGDGFSNKMRIAAENRADWYRERSLPLPARALTTTIPDEQLALKQILQFLTA